MVRRNRRLPIRPTIEFIPASTDPGRIRFFGTFFPGLLLLMQAPGEILRQWRKRAQTPTSAPQQLVLSECDDAGRVGDTLVFVHAWKQDKFDPIAFAQAKTFLLRLARRLRADGFDAEPLDALSPSINLPKLAMAAGLGNQSPFGLLVHPVFGPRVIITAMRTNHPMNLEPRFGGDGCESCMACVLLCPQRPHETGVIDLGLCQRCAKCLEVCPTGKGQRNHAPIERRRNGTNVGCSQTVELESNRRESREKSTTKE